jgi:hypothetical protein
MKHWTSVGSFGKLGIGNMLSTFATGGARFSTHFEKVRLWFPVNLDIKAGCRIPVACAMAPAALNDRAGGKF